MTWTKGPKEKTGFMPDEKQVTLTQMWTGQTGIVVQVQGGHGVVNRLSALGIIPGKRITKISSMLMRGPVIVEVDRTRVAIGFGMATRIVVQLDNKATE
jgi:ferrous iron transport protein A